MELTCPYFDKTEMDNLQACLDSKWVTQGPFAKKFEEQVAQLQKVKYAFAVSNCTAGLHLATLALGLGPGDEVLVPAFTWVTSANCIEYVGAKAVFVDVDPNTFNIDPAKLACALTSRTKAIVAVHLFGLPAAMDEILAFAKSNDLAIIEDAACAIGSSYKGTPVGGIGDIGAFSFHPRKVVTTGEGGMVTTQSSQLAQKIQTLRNHGACGLPPEVKDDPKPYHMALFNELGFNFRLSDIQAAVGVAQMAKLSGLLEHRQNIAERYTQLLTPIKPFKTPHIPDGLIHSYQSYVIRIVDGGKERRNKIMDHLSKNDIQTRPGTHAVHRLGYYASKYGIKPESFPNAANCEDTTITLPIFPGMTFGEQDRVVEELQLALAKS